MRPARYRAVLTGATGGIGRAMALRLAPLCESLLLVGRGGAALAALVREIEAAGGHARAVPADLTTAAGREAVLRGAAESRAGINLLVNNAGVGEFAWLADQDDAALERIVCLNVLAPMQLTRRLLPLLLAQPAARIVNVGSIFGYIGYAGHAAYSASKFALRGFSEALRRELADGPVRVTYFAPRATRTAMNGTAMCALNAELGIAMDPPESVAAALVALLEKPARERPLGMPERLFARLNQIVPGLVDRVLLRHLPVIRRHARSSIPQPTSQGVNI
ncbi:MAG TPA: SDR family oxidoreductase [Burkholderiales bacterium]|nr:SDR family oxidoreductase [Burkholderiales bacterium]